MLALTFALVLARFEVILAIGNGKGGTGKTTLTTALAGEAAHRGRRVLVIDLDVQANTTEHLIGVGDPLRAPQGDGGRALYRMIMDGESAAPVKVSDFLELLPAGPRTQSLADELQRHAATSNEILGRSLAGLRDALHEQTAGFDLVLIDTPPSEQSHAMLDCVLVAADALVIPTKISKADIDGAVKLLQRLAALDRLKTSYALPLGAALMAVPSGAKRLVDHAEVDLEVITRHIPLFSARMHYRPAPISEAERRHTMLRDLQRTIPTQRARFAALRRGDDINEHLSADSIDKSVAEAAALYDEVLERYASLVAAA